MTNESRPWVPPELAERLRLRTRATPFEPPPPAPEGVRPVPDDDTMDADDWGEDQVQRTPVLPRDLSDWESGEDG